MSHARYALSDDEDDEVKRAPSSSFVKSELEPSGAAGAASSAPPASGEDDELAAVERELEVVRLAHAWANERGAPEVLRWRGDLVDSVMDQIQQQQTILDSLASDESTSDEEHFRLNLVQLDVERAKWLLRCYLRTRIVKLEKYATFILTHPAEQQRLSDVELGYLRRYERLSNESLHSSVLQYLPENMRGLADVAPGATDPSGPGGMVPRPNGNEPVFVHCREDCGPVRLSDEEPAAMLAKNSIHFLRYQTVRTLLEQRRVDLL